MIRNPLPSLQLGGCRLNLAIKLRSQLGTGLHAAALPGHWLHPIQASELSEARAALAESRGACVALWTRLGSDASEALPLTAPSIPSAGGARATGSRDSVDVRATGFGSEQSQPNSALSNGTTRRAGRSHGERESIMTGLHFLGCKCCGTHDRHNQVAQVALACFRYELKFSGSTSSVGSNYVGTSADGKSKHTDGQVWGSLSWLRRLAFDVSVVNPTAVSHSGAGACMWRVLSQPECTGRDHWQRCSGDEA